MKKISWLIGLFLLLASCQTTNIYDERVSFLKRHDAMIYQYQKTNPYLCEASFDGLFDADQIKDHAFVFIAVDGAVVSITQTLQHQLNTFLQQSSQNTAILTVTVQAVFRFKWKQIFLMEHLMIIKWN